MLAPRGCAELRDLLKDLQNCQSKDSEALQDGQFAARYLVMLPARAQVHRV